MHINCNELTIRPATAEDAAQLCVWWNDGSIMAHAGFPNGLGITPEKVAANIAANNEKRRLFIIEHHSQPVGEMSYHITKDSDKTAEIGIKICDFALHEKGPGTTLLTIFIDALFDHMGCKKILIDTNLHNKRAQHVYEKKLGFRFLHVAKDFWKDQLGQPQSSVHYEMTPEDWQGGRKDIPKYVITKN